MKKPLGNSKKPSKSKKRKKIFRIILVTLAIVMLWRGVWGLLDHYLFHIDPVLGYGVSIVIAFLILYIDDFHLKELE